MWYAFKVNDFIVNQQGKQSYHWVITDKYSTKKAILNEYNQKGYARKVTKIFTLKQLLENYGVIETKRILLENKYQFLNY